MTDDRSIPQAILERLEQAEELKLAGKYEEAIAMLEQLLLEDPQNVSALEEIADNELSLERYDRAETAAKQAIDLDAKSYTGEYILGFLRSHQGKWEEAIAHLRHANALKANNPEILRCLGWALFNTGQRPQGIVTLERALNLDHESALTLCDLGVAYLGLHNLQKAKALFLRALDLDPGNPRAKECVAAVERFERDARTEESRYKKQDTK
jgi:tetratricopeptide (TPR) repeat protein